VSLRAKSGGALGGNFRNRSGLDHEAADDAEHPQTDEWRSGIARLGAAVDAAAAENAETLDLDRYAGRHDDVGAAHEGDPRDGGPVLRDLRFP
jgi:hypothetical protein